MTWVSLGQINLTQDWYFTAPVVGEVFRVIHTPLTNAENKYLKAVIAQGFTDDRLNLFNPQRLSYRLESEIFTFYFPSGIAEQKLYLKRLDDTDLDWIVEVEVYQAASAIEELTNYLKSRFGDTTIMDYLVSRNPSAKSVSPVTWKPNAKSATVDSIIAANTARMYLVVRTSERAVNLYATKDNEGKGQNLIEKVEPQQVFILPSQGAIYRGEIFAQSVGGDSDVTVTEYS